MTAALVERTFADITVGRAWYRIDDVYDPATRTHTDVPALHYDLDCRWPPTEGRQVVTRGGADIVDEQPYFDACDRWGDSGCPDAPDHARPVAVCPWCAPTLTGVA
jgi:hypothetical protein